MSTKHILILNGHPAKESLSKQFAEQYAVIAEEKNNDIRVHHLNGFDFDVDFEFTKYSQAKPLEPVLEKFIEDLKWCDHFVLCTPMWWGGLPAKLKGLIDRSFLPGSVFDTRVKKGAMPKPMLKDKTARVIITSDTPGWIMRLLYKNALIHQLRGQILGFVGIKPMKVTWFAGAGHATEETIDKWIKTVKELAISTR